MRSRGLVLGLVASLALNLFLIGAAAGVVALGLRMAQDGRPGALVRATRELPQPDRRQMRQMLADTWRGARPDIERSRGLRVEAWSAVADPKPDAPAIKAKLAQSRQIDLGVRATVEERLVDYVLGLPPSDRAIFAQGMRRVLTPPSTPAPPPGGR